MTGFGKSQGLTLGWLLLALACGSSGKGSSDPAAAGSGATGAGGDASSTEGGKTGAGGGKSTAGQASAGEATAEQGGANAAAGTAGAGGAADTYAPEFVDGACVPKGPPIAEVPGVEVIDEYPEELGDYITAVALHAGALYWAYWQEGIYRRPAGTTEQELVVDTAVNVRNLVATADYIYWIQDNDEKLMRASLATLPATPEQILVDVRALGLTADAQNLYFIRSGELGIFKLAFAAALPGGDATPIALVTDQRSVSMSPNSARLFYVTNQAIYAVPIAGGAVTNQGPNGAITQVLATEDTLFGATDEDIYWRVVDGPTNGSGNTPLARGNFASATSPYRVPLEEMRLEGDRLYYREETGALAWVQTDASDCRITARIPAPIRSENLQWVMDEAHFYVIQEDKKLLSIPK
jgi:hypothetical protein